MMLRYNILLFFVFCAFLSIGQEEDFSVWSGISIEKEVSKSTSFKYKGQFRFDQNGSHFKTFINQIEVKHKVTKWMRVGLRFRHASSRSNDYMRYTGTVSFRHDLGDIRLGLRNQLQNKWETYGLRSLETETNVVVARSRFTVAYKYNKHLSFDVNSEVLFDAQSGLSLIKWRLGAGTSIRLTKELDLEFQYYYQEDVPGIGSTLKVDHIFVNGLSYAF